ncbi:phage baseplate assembly protein V [Niveibacterium sp. 24ML]|uniref:phage baseplate assembly protein V n=1 Tax=Niveibacterium sp. 24ML TaxID=2985512 RepID=UPI00226DFA86|nr:phage baseplate assembly protein V [Niveibacterium sp. 24ML]MCX9158488.1 phage baseplate assembly protein V [Niveibacterium sp. 24ML]
MNLTDELRARSPAGLGGPWFGVYPAQVTDIKDPDGQGRVRVKLPWLPDSGSAQYESWARLTTMMTGNNRGSWFIPDVGDEVLVAFVGGNARHPCVVGALWNGSDAPPESMDGSGNNYLKVIRSRNGVKLTLDDQDGQEKFIVETPGGQKITLQDGPGKVEVIDSNGNSIKLETAGITIEAAAKVTVNASNVEVSAGMVTVNAGMSRFSGVVQCDTLISNSVISASYTPGAGNIW